MSPAPDYRQQQELEEREQMETKSTALYVLVDEYKAAAAKLADLDLDEQTVADTLEGLAGAVEVKATNVAMFVRNIEAAAEAIKNAEMAMSLRRKSIENRAEHVRDYLKSCMLAAKISRIECPYFVLAIKQNPPAVVIEDAATIPAQYMRQKPPPPPEPDKTKIKDAIKAGTDVPGANLVQGSRLEIK